MKSVSSSKLLLGILPQLLVKSFSKDCESNDDLKLKLADELPEEDRGRFLEKVNAGKAPTKKKNNTTATFIAIAAIIIVALIVINPFSKSNGKTGEENKPPPVDTHVDVRGVTKDKVELGMSAAFSGPSRELGRYMQIGLKTCFEEINEAGGIHGRQIHLIARDDAYEPERAVENLDDLFDPKEGIFAMIGNVGTPTAKAILPKALEDGTLVFGTFSGAQLLRRVPPDSYVFNYRASYAEEVDAIINYFVKENSVKPEKVAVFYQEDSYGKDVLNGVNKALRKLGVNSAKYLRNLQEKYN